MALEIAPEKRVSLTIVCLYMLEFSGARSLLCKNAMQLRIDAMRVDRRQNEPGHRLLNRLRSNFFQGRADNLHQFLIMPLDNGYNE